MDRTEWSNDAGIAGVFPGRGFRAAPRKKFCASLVTGTLLFLCALSFYYFAVLKIDYHKTELLDLGWSDAAEYFAQAKAMLKGEYPTLNFGHKKLPSRFPMGYPVLMLPWLKILPEADSVLAPYRTNQTIGLLLLLTVFGFYAYLRMPLAGGVAALLLATLPAFFTLCRSSLSDISASAFVALAFMSAYLGLTEEHCWKIYMSAVFLGLSVNIRVQSLFFAPLLLAMALFPIKKTRLRWFLHCLAMPIVLVLAMSPSLVTNTILFHSPLKTGYGFWIVWPPSLGEQPPYFSLRYIPMNLAYFWNEFSLRGNSSSNVLGPGTSFIPAFILLTCVGLFFIRMNRFAVCALLSALSFLAATLAFAISEPRYYLPLLILAVAVAVLPTTWAVQNLFIRRRIIPALAVLILFCGACLGYPSRASSGARGIDHSRTREAFQFDKLGRPPRWFLAQKHFVEMFGYQPCLVLADINPFYLNALLPDGIVAAHLDGERLSAFKHIHGYDRAEVLALVQHAVAQSLPVYALFVSREEMEQKSTRLPQIGGYNWTPTADAAILKLSSSGR
jgi:hypothetical protein